MSLERWDIFCKVVDNFGDIGVAWRLARTLGSEHRLQVRLWVDDLASFARISPGLDPQAAAQSHHGIEIRAWREPFFGIEPADVVVETFQCELPGAYVQAMAALQTKPRWINLDYLSAEPWVRGCHGLPSPHPRLPLVKYFFFPGFEAGTGGLLLEHGLFARRDAFLADAPSQAALWKRLGAGERRAAELRISMFCYETAPVEWLLDAWAGGDRPVSCFMPEGRAAERVRALPNWSEAGSGWITRGSLRLQLLPFTDQDLYDHLLWACDVNFVRGEDSFVRAQWSLRPWLWNIYPQRENAHWVKLNAFLDRYCDALPAQAATAVRELWRAWNGLSRPAALTQAWESWLPMHATMERHAQAWAGRLATHGTLTDNLVRFCSVAI